MVGVYISVKVDLRRGLWFRWVVVAKRNDINESIYDGDYDLYTYFQDRVLDRQSVISRPFSSFFLSFLFYNVAPVKSSFIGSEVVESPVISIPPLVGNSQW